MGGISVISNARAKTRSKPREMARETPAAFRNDVTVYRIVVAVLGLVMLAAVAGAFVQLFHPGEPPQLLIALGTGALGALGGLLAPSPVTGK